MAFVFFFSGMAFKISLVPFHLWTADVYEGAPSTVTAYLSVISKGSAAFVLMTILIKVFAPMMEHWQEVLYWVTIASITIANLFAYPPAEPETSDGILQYLAGRIYHAGCHRWHGTGNDRPGLLCT